MADYTDKLIQPGFYDLEINICWDCERCCGKCPWTAVDDETGTVKFEPVDGWKTKKHSKRNGRNWEIVEQIVYCPLFDPHESQKGKLQHGKR